ncbi:MAG: PAS domain S-box protein [Tepidisphaeraceae bacterium]|jgi:PAS domain S-box-containing protein
MSRGFRKLLAGPDYPDQEQMRQGRLVHVLTLAVAVAVILPIMHNALAGNWPAAWVLVGGEVGVFVTFRLNRCGKLKWAIPLLCYVLLASATALLCVATQGIHDLAIMLYPGALVVAAMLLDTRRFIIFVMAAMLSATGVIVAGRSGVLVVQSGDFPSLRNLLDAILILALTSLAVGLLARSLREGLTRSRHNEAELAAANTKLEEQAARARLSEERYRGIIELAVDGILFGDAQGRIVGANTRASELTGYPTERLLGLNISSLFAGVELERAPLRYDLLKQGLSVITERTLTRLDGTMVTVEMNSKLMPDATYQAFVRDITERVRVNEALRKSEERYRLLFNSGMDAVFVHRGPRDGLPGEFLEINDVACARLGYTREELLKMSPVDIDAPDTLPNVPRMMERLVRDGHAVWEGVHLARDGRRIPVEISNHLFELDGKPAILSTAHDLTERKQATEAARKSERSYREIFNAANDAIFVHDAKTGAILDVNDTMLAMFGYSREEALHLAPDQASEGSPPHSADRAMQWLRKAVEEGPQVFEWLSRRKNGELFWTEVALRSTQIGGHGRVLAVVRDISERKRAEEERAGLEQQLRQAQKMEAIGQLAGGIAHDFNNLVTVICGYTEMAIAGLPADHPLRQSLSQVIVAGERARDLTRQILAFGRKQTLKTEVINLNAEVPATEKMIRRLIGEDIAVSIRLSPGLGNVRADASQLQQVLLNLAVNARDAMPRGGRLAIETADVTLDEAYPATSAEVRSGPYVMLSVSDTGCGMDRETLAHLFEPFFTTKPPGKGTGLGLATAFGIIRQHGGHISVSSEVGKGSTFRIYLPRVESELTTAQPPAPARPDQSAAATETVLLVEDEANLRELVFQILSERGYRVLNADGAADAQRLATAHAAAIDLLLTDVVMPEVNGPELYNRLAPICPRMKVLYMSGYAEGVFNHGADGRPDSVFLAKPFRIQTLLDKVREAIERCSRDR